MFRTLLTSTLALSAIVATAPVVAEPVSAVVSYADLNLSSPNGVAVLEQRINATANRICGKADPRDLDGTLQVKSCRKVALASSRTQFAMATQPNGIRIASR